MDILGVGLKRVVFFPFETFSVLTSMLLRMVRLSSAVISTSKVALTAGSSCFVNTEISELLPNREMLDVHRWVLLLARLYENIDPSV